MPVQLFHVEFTMGFGNIMVSPQFRGDVILGGTGFVGRVLEWCYLKWCRS